MGSKRLDEHEIQNAIRQWKSEIYVTVRSRTTINTYYYSSTVVAPGSWK